MAVMGCSLSRVLVVLALLFLGYNAFTIYAIFYPAQCSRSDRCIPPRYPLTTTLEVCARAVYTASRVCAWDQRLCCHSVQLWVYSSSDWSVQTSAHGMREIAHWRDLLRSETQEKCVCVHVGRCMRMYMYVYTHTHTHTRTVNVTLPKSTLNNGSLYAHVFLGPKGKSPLKSNDVIHMSVGVAPLTQYSLVQASSFNLLFGSKSKEVSGRGV